jgi:hypothetical protein
LGAGRSTPLEKLASPARRSSSIPGDDRGVTGRDVCARGESGGRDTASPAVPSRRGAGELVGARAGAFAGAGGFGGAGSAGSPTRDLQLEHVRNLAPAGRSASWTRLMFPHVVQVASIIWDRFYPADRSGDV